MSEPAEQARQPKLTDEERKAYFDRLVLVNAEAQATYDKSVRAMAAGGITATVSLGTALGSLTNYGVAAAAVFLLSLTVNLVSYGTAQADLGDRMEKLRKREYPETSKWAHATVGLNVIGGVGVIAGGGLLGAFIATST